MPDRTGKREQGRDSALTVQSQATLQGDCVHMASFCRGLCCSAVTVDGSWPDPDLCLGLLKGSLATNTLNSSLALSVLRY